MKLTVYLLGLLIVLTFTAATLFPSDAHADMTRYVKTGGTGDGTSWVTASGTLQAMIDAVEVSGGGTICVASGTYTPIDIIQPGTPRSAAFQMKNGVAIYGGFPNTGSPSWIDRDWDTYKTILSGEIGNPGTTTDNCYHVFHHPNGTNLNASAQLDGFTITGGNANGTGWQNSGGGMLNWESSPYVTNCVFKDNTAHWGGGMNNSFTSLPILTNCYFIGNHAYGSGAGIYNYNSSPTVTSCHFLENSSDGNGGGIHNDFNSSANIINSAFIGNTAHFDGGGVFNWASSVTIDRCHFSVNYAEAHGGGLLNHDSLATITNTTFSENEAHHGGGIYIEDSSPSLTNCTVNHNTAYSGGGIHNWESIPVITNCTISNNTADNTGGGIVDNHGSSPIVTNSIIWGNTSDYVGDNISIYSSTPIYTFCDIQVNPGSPVHPGKGNIKQDPLFTDPANGDFHLQAISPCIDSGSNAAIFATGITEDFDGDPRIINGTVEMGVDETEGWSCLDYDTNTNGDIDFSEMVDALMDYLTSKLGYAQMVDVLMCYLTA